MILRKKSTSCNLLRYKHSVFRRKLHRVILRLRRMGRKEEIHRILKDLHDHDISGCNGDGPSKLMKEILQTEDCVEEISVVDSLAGTPNQQIDLIDVDRQFENDINSDGSCKKIVEKVVEPSKCLPLQTDVARDHRQDCTDEELTSIDSDLLLKRYEDAGHVANHKQTLTGEMTELKIKIIANINNATMRMTRENSEVIDLCMDGDYQKIPREVIDLDKQDGQFRHHVATSSQSEEIGACNSYPPNFTTRKNDVILLDV